MNDPAEPSDRDRPLAGIGRFTWKLSLGTALAVVAVIVALRLGGGSVETMPRVDRRTEPDLRAGTPPLPPPRPPAAAQAGSSAEPAVVVTETAREVERRYAAGELAEAQRRFEPCTGGDVRRVAWIDRQQRVVKLLRQRANGFVVEEWFDDSGRLREGLVRATAAGRSWTRRVTLDERGVETELASSAGAPDDAPPPLVHSNSTGAFFAGAGCEK